LMVFSWSASPMGVQATHTLSSRGAGPRSDGVFLSSCLTMTADAILPWSYSE
jgi:hypothetical protein